jgi:hypothetical protein
MIEFMSEGGWSMWFMLISAIAVVVIAALRSPKARPQILLAGCILTIIESILGMATGMAAVANHYDQFPDKVGAVAAGLSELSNNGTFGAALALALGIAAIVTYQQASGKP